MKFLGWFAVFLLISLCQVSAQVTVDLALDQDQFLAGESLTVAVRITNRSGQTLHLGADPSWLTFAVESKDQFVVVKSGDAPVQGEFDLESSKRAIKRVDIQPYFNMQQPGRYTITATVDLPQWNQQITSPAKSFDIIQAARLKEFTVGVPRPGGASNQPPELRQYTLLQANYLRKQLVLYVRLSDQTGRFNKVFPIGPMLSFGQPEPEIDKFSNLHVLYQNGPHAFSHVVVNPEGNLILRESYDYTTRPKLEVDTNGILRVVGGARRVASDDIPTQTAPDTNGPALP
jgi:hypothetical protein